MDMKNRRIILWSGVAVLVVAGIVTLSLSFGGSKDTAVDDVNAIYTNAAATVAAQHLTLQAALLSVTPTPPLGSPTATLARLPSPTFQLLTPVLQPTSTSALAACDKSVYVSDVTIPDGTAVTPGQIFTKTWKVSNTGTCAWTAAYQVIFISGDGMGGKATPIGKAVNPGEAADISVVLTAPASGAGNITGYWRLSNDKSQPFGEQFYVTIKLGGAAVPTATATTIAYPNP